MDCITQVSLKKKRIGYIKVIFPENSRLLPLYVFLFAALVEGLQAVNVVELLGLSDNRFISVLFGTTFDWKDIACYGMGCVLCGLWEIWIWRNRNKAEIKM